MSGHKIAPFELWASRRHARGEAADNALILGALNEEEPVDLLDAIADNILDVDAYTNTDNTMRIEPQAYRLDGDVLEVTFAIDVSGVREIIRDGLLPGRPIKAVKGQDDVARLFSCCALWRPAGGERGLLLIHSPFGRGGSKAAILRLLQRAVNGADNAKAKLHADALIPRDAVDRMLRNADATKIIYSRGTGIRSSFGAKSKVHSARAELDLVIKGSDTKPFRDALKAAMQSGTGRDQLYTVRVRDDERDDGYRNETFEEVEVVFTDAVGSATYSMTNDTVPRVRYELTNEVNAIYFALVEGEEDKWAEQLMNGVSADLCRLVDTTRRGLD